MATGSESNSMGIKGNRTSQLYLVAAFVTAGILLFFSFQGVSWEELFAALQRTKVEFLGVSAITYVIILFLRSLRWRCLLGAEKELGRLPVFWATSLGYVGNVFLPARAGEMIRSVLVARLGSISTSFVLATIVAERVLDALVLVLVSLLALSFMEAIPPLLSGSAGIMGIVGIVGLIILFALPRLEKPLSQILSLLPLPKRIRQILLRFLAQFLLGLLSFQNFGRSLRFAGFTAIIWLAEAAMTIVVAKSLDLDLTLPQAMLMLTAIGLSSAIPSTPGYIGIYQFAAVAVLTSFGFPRTEVLAFSFILQANNYSVVALTGMAGMWRLGTNWRTFHSSDPNLPKATM